MVENSPCPGVKYLFILKGYKDNGEGMYSYEG
jgi:hypothetical protein